MGPTLLDIVKANGNDAVVGLIDETIKAHPELTMVEARTIKGLNYKARVRTELGRVTGSFRNANEGLDPIKSKYETRMFETFILNPRFECDRAVADRYEDGPKVYIAEENQGVMEGEMQGLGSQFYYGVTNNAKGHPGLIKMYDTDNMVVDAGGTTANTGSSVWLIETGPQAVRWVWGENGLFQMSDLRVETLRDAANKPFDGYVSSLTAYPGLQVASLQSVVRIKKLTADANKGLTDALLAAALSKFPVGRSPNLILASRRSLFQLQVSRTPTLVIGDGKTAPSQNMAPLPKDYGGIPIMATDSIKNTESLTL